MDGIEFVPRTFLEIWDPILYPYIFDYDWQTLEMIFCQKSCENEFRNFALFLTDLYNFIIPINVFFSRSYVFCEGYDPKY